MAIDYEKEKIKRLVLAPTAMGALGAFLVKQLQVQPIGQAELLQLAKKQGYTPATTRDQLEMMKVAKLIEHYLDEKSDTVTVKLAANGLQRIEGARNYE